MTITSINGASFCGKNAITKIIIKLLEGMVYSLVTDAPNYVVTITSIERASVVDAAETVPRVNDTVPNASNYVITVSGIERALVGEAAEPVAREAEIVPSVTIEYVVTSKSISAASIDEYFLHPRGGDNISLVGKRYS
jgi:hypothetical protein